MGAMCHGTDVSTHPVASMSMPTAPPSGEAVPCVFVNHGGGPLPLLGQQPEVATFLRSYAATLPQRPRAVLVVTAHWEESHVTVSTGARPQLLFDYGGFPPESYRFTYPAPGAPELAARAVDLLTEAGIPARADSRRGWDHGVFVPMMLMFPAADVPILQMSVLRSQDAGMHLKVGQALVALRHEGVLIVGSGFSFHNFKYFFASGATKAAGSKHSVAFDGWLRDQIVGGTGSPDERLRALAAWERAPSAHEAHPAGAAEHLMPLFVVCGAGGGLPGETIGDDVDTKRAPEVSNLADFKVSNFQFK